MGDIHSRCMNPPFGTPRTKEKTLPLRGCKCMSLGMLRFRKVCGKGPLGYANHGVLFDVERPQFDILGPLGVTRRAQTG